MEEMVRFSETDFKNEFAEMSTEEVMYPQYREKYMIQTEKYIVKALEGKNLSCMVDVSKRTICVSTNRRTRDPFIFIKGVNFVKLVSRGVEVAEAMKILEDEYFCEVVDIKSMVKCKERFERRRERLIGPSGVTLKAIRMLTGCHVLVQGKTVSVIGGYRGVEEVKKTVVECMNNVLHPVYQIKRLIEKRKLEGDATKAGEDWERFLPRIKKSSKRSKKVVARRTGELPSDIPARKEDIAMETGEYFMGDGCNEDERKEARRRAREARERKKEVEEMKYVAPEE